jgi:dynactin 5
VVDVGFSTFPLWEKGRISIIPLSLQGVMMVVEERVVDLQQHIQTSTGTLISRRAAIYKPQALEIPTGKIFIADHVHVRADLAPVQLQKYTYIEQGVTIRPSYLLSSPLKFIPITIGAYSYIGTNSTIQAACIGMGCIIGKNCVIGSRCILKDYVQVLDDTVLSPDTVIPPFSIVAGAPAKVIGYRPESTVLLAQAEATERYNALNPIKL